MKTEHTLSAADANSGDQRQNNSIRRKRFALALGGFLFTSIFALSAPLAEAQCKQWNVGGGWRFKQGPTAVQVNLRRKGTVVTGTASHVLPTKASGGELLNGFQDFGGTQTVSGTVDGTVDGDQFAVKIEWNNNTTGVYEGTIGPSGKIEGMGWEIRSPKTRVRWYSETRMVCADAAAEAKAKEKAALAKSAAAQAEQIKAAAELAANNKAAAAEAAKAPPPVLSAPGGEAEKSTRPYLRALPQIVSIPRGGTEAPTKLVWFAGNDHPNAQLVVAVNGGDERVVDSQRKGSRQVTVKAGQRHVYTLSDAGEPLASVVVQTDQSARPDRLRGNQRQGPQDGESDNNENQGDE